MASFQNLNFTSSSEDGRTELAALDGVEGRILTLTGSGTRPLDMLLSSASEVIALDSNPAQNALLGLKVAAISTLDHDDLLRFLGVLPDEDRITHYHKLRAALSAQDAAFWDHRGRVLSKGVIYAGWLERVLRLGAFGQLVLRSGSLDALFNAPDTEAQTKIWRDRFDDRIWRGSIRLFARRWIWSKLMGEAQAAYLPKPREAEEIISDRFTRASENFLFRESDVASLMLRGRISAPDALPLHLRAENHDKLRARIGLLRRVQGNLADLGRLDLAPVDGFALSDFGSYCESAAYEAAWKGILAVASPDARYCERILLNPQPLPSERIKIDQALSDRLTQNDRAVIHDIRAGSISASL